jgi:fluoride ion exporter CrcB/FEX
MHANVTLKPREFVMALSSAALGGFVGTLLRDIFTSLEHLPTLSAHVSWPQEIPWALLALNFVGAFLATRLLRGPLRGHDSNDRTRILIITGFFGGLTSYSGLFVSFATLWHVCVGGCLLVAAGAVVSGVVAGWLGLLHHRR